MTENYQNIIKKLEALRIAGLDFGRLQEDIRAALDRLEWDAKHSRMVVDNGGRTERIAGLILERISPGLRAPAGVEENQS